jgi:hypothetical protein
MCNEFGSQILDKIKLLNSINAECTTITYFWMLIIISVLITMTNEEKSLLNN